MVAGAGPALVGVLCPVHNDHEADEFGGKEETGSATQGYNHRLLPAAWLLHRSLPDFCTTSGNLSEQMPRQNQKTHAAGASRFVQ